MTTTHYLAERAAALLELQLQPIHGIQIHSVSVGIDSSDASKPALFVYYRGSAKIARAKVPTVFHDLKVTRVNIGAVIPARRSP